MSTKMKVGATALLMTFVMIDQAFAELFPSLPPAPTPVPEFDGPSGLAAVMLLVGVGAILFSRSKNR